MLKRVEKYDKFTERARHVLTLAQEEARRFNHNYIGPEHLVLGLVGEGNGIAARVLGNLGVQLPQVREAVGSIIGRGEAMIGGEIGLTPRAKKVIELAVDEARRLNHNYIGTEHLLLGLVREGDGIAAEVLEARGVTLPRIRDEIVREIALMERVGPMETARDKIARVLIGKRTTEPSGPKGNVVTCRIDDRDLDALDMLVEAGIRTTRSDAASWLIHAGIEAHQPLFDKVNDTLAEIRRLRTEAQAIARQLTDEGQAASPPDDRQPGLDEAPPHAPTAPPA